MFQWEVRAQFIPIDEKLTIKINKNTHFSSYTGFREIILRNPKPILPAIEPIVANHQKEMKTGFMGMGDKQVAKFGIELQKNVFSFGEQIQIKVMTDN